MNINSVVSHYNELKKQKESIEQKAKEDVAPIKQNMEQIEAALQKYMLDQGVNSLPCDAGTPYLSRTNKAMVTDWEAVLDYAKANEAWDLFERRVNKKAAEQYGEVPGVELTTILKTNIRGRKNE